MVLKMLQSKYGGISLGEDKDTDDFKYFTYLDFPRITSEHKNVMSHCLTKKVFNDLKHKITNFGFSLSNAIQPGIEKPNLKVGLVAGDKASYQVFNELFNKVIRVLHNFDSSTDIHRYDINPGKLDLRELKKFDLDKYIISTRIRGVRNISGFALPPGTSDGQRTEVEDILRAVFKGFTGKLKGSYSHLGDIDSGVTERLRNSGKLFQEVNVYSKLFNSGSTRHWPRGRGLFLNNDENVMCWVNEEDHCHIAALQNGSDILKVFDSFNRLSNVFEEQLQKQKHSIMYDDTLGFISTCPSNIGTGLRVSVKIKLPKLIAKRFKLEDICSKARLRIRGNDGEDVSVSGNILDISNKETVGFTETELVQKLVNGLVHILAAEQSL